MTIASPLLPSLRVFKARIMEHPHSYIGTTFKHNSQLSNPSMDASLSILPSGDYYIFSKATDCIVGRHINEDRSLRPKGIYTIDPAARGPGRIVKSPFASYRIAHLTVSPVVDHRTCRRGQVQDEGWRTSRWRARQPPLGCLHWRSYSP